MGLRHILVLLACCSLFPSPLLSEELIEGYSREEALRLGERMYREGILPSGEPMQALVMGDIPFDGRMFTCDDCHQRSGLGSEEGTVITWPTNGKELYIPRRRTGAFRPPATDVERENVRRNLPEYYQVEDARPAYTDQTLGKLLLTGIDPSGRKLDPIMPKFRLSKKDQAILIYYLKQLSSEYDPGVDDTTLYFATVITPGVTEIRKTVMLDALKAHISAHNSESRHESRRAESGPFYKSERHKAYRKLDLQVWELTGDESSWRQQLEDYYARRPVFAMLGGITSGSWEPIHAFSEDHEIPTLFPITDLPVISDTDWYTLYFSKGYYQQGESVAKYLRGRFGTEHGVEIVQITRENNRQSAAAGRGFRTTWESIGGDAIREIILGQGEEMVPPELLHRSDKNLPVVFLVWLPGGDSQVFQTTAQEMDEDALLFGSATLLDYDYAVFPKDLRPRVLLTYPYSLPGAEERSRFSVERWYQLRKIPTADFTLEAKMYFIGWMLPGAIKHMRSEFYRDYFLEGFDMMTDQDYAVAVYPRLTFGSGQRYASKGCYIVQLPSDPAGQLIPVNDWVTY